MKQFNLPNTICILLILGLTILYLLYPSVGFDSSYYLANAKEIYEGKIYFKEIATLYNPIAIFILGMPYLVDSNPDFRYSLSINLFFIWLCAYLLYKILNTFNNNKKSNIFYTLYFIIVCYALNSGQILLEPISVFFQLCAILFYLKSNQNFVHHYLVLAGIAIGLSFLSKQYGLFILAPIGIDLLMTKKNILKKCLLVTLGLSIPVLTFYFYLNSYGMQPKSFIYHLIGKGNTLDIGTGTGLNYSFSTYIYLIAYNLYILLFPILLFRYFRIKNYNNSIFLLFLPFSLFVLLTASYDHYFVYILPYLIIAFTYLMMTTKILLIEKYKNIALFSSILLVVISAYKSYSRNIISYPAQIESAIKFNEIVPKNSKVYLDGPAVYYYYLCNYKSINLSKLGYTFPGFFYPKTIVKFMDANSYVVTSDKNVKEYELYLKNGSKRKIIIDDKEFFILTK